ncbi:MAG: SDR family NAD(P)-dependent oxidoreductase [Acidobacteriota bacterium]
MIRDTPSTIRCAVVTGGTDGIGREIALGLAQAGSRVIVVGRGRARGEAAQRWLRESAGNRNVEFLAADLGLVREVDRLAGEILRRFPRLDDLVHSAGVVLGRRELTPEGVEVNFAVNYLARFALTMRLLPMLEASGASGRAAKILLVSGAARNGRVRFDDVNLSRGFSTLRAVWQSCCANDLFAVELARRLSRACGAARPHVMVNCLKIGVVKTGIRRNFPRWMRWAVPLLADPLLAQTPADAAESALKLLLDEAFESESGQLWSKIRSFRRVSPEARVADPAERRRLWELSEAMTDAARGGPHRDPLLERERGGRTLRDP